MKVRLSPCSSCLGGSVRRSQHPPPRQQGRGSLKPPGDELNKSPAWPCEGGNEGGSVLSKWTPPSPSTPAPQSQVLWSRGTDHPWVWVLYRMWFKCFVDWRQSSCGASSTLPTILAGTSWQLLSFSHHPDPHLRSVVMVSAATGQLILQHLGGVCRGDEGNKGACDVHGWKQRCKGGEVWLSARWLCWKRQSDCRHTRRDL